MQFVEEAEPEKPGVIELDEVPGHMNRQGSHVIRRCHDGPWPR